MASAQATDRIAARFKLSAHDHDPGGTTATIVSADGGTTLAYVDFRDYDQLGVVAAPSIVGGAMTKLEIVAATDAAFTTPVVIKDSGTVAADANGDYVFLECDSDDLANAGTNLRYVAGRLTHATGTDESVVFYMAVPRNPKDGLTATTIA